MKTITLAIVALSSFLVGCGDDPMADAEGIYFIDSHTENLQACTEGGESLAEADGPKYVVARQSSALGISFLNMLACDDPVDCRAVVAKVDAQEFFAIDFGYTIVDDNGDLESGDTTSGFSSDGVCSGGSTGITRATLTDNGLAIVVERIAADDYPLENGGCTTEGAALAAADNSCSSRIDLRATFVESL
ncbi:MAG: hypothetical protein JKY56_27415 [Kofleriaceae bacterium]|nr:hypothetical protein [Kofleriaceae bacterium]